jgi:hypothetical protein
MQRKRERSIRWTRDEKAWRTRLVCEKAGRTQG